MAEADTHPKGFLEIHGRGADQEVRHMVKDGLVEATYSNGQEELVTTIHRVTDLGRECLRAFQAKQTPTADEPAQVSPTAVLEKWKAIFASGLPRLETNPTEST